jgi:hypothetical protein
MTTVMQADRVARRGFMLFAVLCALSSRGMAVDNGKTYTPSMPEEWKPSLALGQFKVIGEPFFGVCCKAFGMCPVVRIEWSVQNLTADPMYLDVNYRSPNPSGAGKTGYGVAYLLKPHEKRAIHDIVPVWTVRSPVTLAVYLIEMRLPGKRSLLSPPHLALQTDPISPPREPSADLAIANDANGRYSVTRAQVAAVRAGENALEVAMKNSTQWPGSVGIQVSVGDPSKADRGAPGITAINRSTGSYMVAGAVMEPQGATVGRTVFDVPTDAGAAPLLVFRVFETIDRPAQAVISRLGLTPSEIERCQSAGDFVHAGSIDLHKVAAAGKIALPPAIPVAERAMLISETPSEHFLFRYRPDSYAERNITSIIMSRESAYKKLHTLLRMDIPVMITIDLYPDMEAKALGSGTAWTNANTVNNHQIAEVYNQWSQCDASHELAHIFSFHFGGGGGGLCEPFATYCEADTDIAAAKARLGVVLTSGAAKPLRDSLGTPGDESWTFIDYLLKQDVSKFKRFYTRVSSAETLTSAVLDDASRKVYGADFAKLEEQWRAYVLGKP